MKNYGGGAGEVPAGPPARDERSRSWRTGWELTLLEVEALLATETGLWSDVADRIDPRLQRDRFKDRRRGGPMKILLAIDDRNARKGPRRQSLRSCVRTALTCASSCRHWEHIVRFLSSSNEALRLRTPYQALRDVTVRDAAALVARAARQLAGRRVWHQHRRREGEPCRTILDCAADWRPT